MTTTNQTQWEKTHLPCPKCTSSDAYSIAADGHGYCFSCNSTIPADKQKALDEVQKSRSLEFVPWRGISRDSMRFYDALTAVEDDGKPFEIVFPYANNSEKHRLIDEKKFYSKGNIREAGLFGMDKFSSGQSQAVTITEGEADCMACFQMLGSKYPCLSVQSASTAKRDCTKAFEYLNAFEKIYVCFDNDEPGLKAFKEVAALFDYSKIYFVKLTLKDACEYLQSGRIQEFRNVWYNSTKYLPDNVVSTLQDFHSIVTEPPAEADVQYPFQCLNEKLFGLRAGEVTLVTAQEGVGKTEFVRAIEYKCLTDTDENVAVIHLEENKRRTLRGYAGLYLDKPCHIPDCGVSDTDLETAIDAIVKTDNRLHIYSHFGSSDPGVIVNTVRFLTSAANCKYLIFDHITMVTSGNGEDERVALDSLSTRLRMLVEELQFSLVLVSHVNDNGLTRGSRNISKIADSWINLTRNLEEENEKERNTTYVTLKKNRFFGETGPVGKLYFDKKKFKLVDYRTALSKLPPIAA